MSDPLRVDVLERIPDQVEWDALVDVTAAPFLYRADALAAYLRTPLQHGTRARFVTFRQSLSRRLDAALPVFILPATDPLDILARMVSGYAPDGGPLSLSHVWHWYDTRVLRRSRPDALAGPLADALHNVGRSVGAQLTGLINVAARDPILALLGERGFTVTCVDARLRADLTQWSDAEEWLRSLDSGTRQDMRRQLRRSSATGCEVRCERPTPSSARAVAELCTATGAKHGNPGWYPAAELADLIMAWRDNVVLTTIRRDDVLLAASVGLVDGVVFHNWAAGTMPYSSLGFSPYAVLLHESVRAATELRCEILEGGRRNEEWKRRRGFEQVMLYAALAPVSG